MILKKKKIQLPIKVLEGLTCKRVQIRLNSSKKELEPRGEEKRAKNKIANRRLRF